MICRCLCRTWLRCGTSPWWVLCSTLPAFWSFLSFLRSRPIVPTQASPCSVHARSFSLASVQYRYCEVPDMQGLSQIQPCRKASHTFTSSRLHRPMYRWQPDFVLLGCRPFFLPCLAVALLSVMATLSSIFLLQETLPRIVADKQLPGAKYHKLKGELQAFEVF